MTPVVEGVPRTRAKTPVSWTTLLWFGALLIGCYAPVLLRLIHKWQRDEDMGHGFFVPLVAGYIAWEKRKELALQRPQPTWWGLVVVAFGAVQLYLATLGAELFLTRTSLIITLIGMVLLLGGPGYVRTLKFPLFLLFFMVPIPEIIYNQITFPLQLLASRAAESALLLMQIPVLREGNILELADQRLSVVEACSGIRSLLSLTFLALVYGYFFEKKNWMRVVLFFATVPIAIIANASRVALTGMLAEYRPELAKGFFHEASGWVIFMIAVLILVTVHQVLNRSWKYLYAIRQVK